MQTRLADCLLLVLPETLPLSAWQRADVLAREWELFRRLRDWYPRIVVATPGGDEERSALAAVDKGPVTFLHGVVRKNPPDAASVRAAVGDARSVVVRTLQICGCDAAVPITHALRTDGRRVTMIARSGFLWSKFAALDEGPHTEAAREVARREREVCRAADSIIAVTQRMIDDLAWKHALDPSRCSVVTNYVLTDHPAMKSEGREANVALTTGPLVKRRRIHLLIQAIADIAETGAKLTVLGDGPEAGGLRALAESLGAPVTFIPTATYAERLRLMSTCSVFMYISQLEGHPKAALEAMSCGAPLIVSDAQGVGSIVHHGVTGLRIAPEPEALAHAMRDLLADQEWRDVLGASAARMTLTNFGIAAVLEEELAAHRKAVSLTASAPKVALSA
ncbi:MAG: glycosyltransferase family 4 protein [Phycisphaerales bacterium]